tara:strand:- start:305 stop:595 length:291 start_codon:yes stop_codon:yes gene_type:complete
MSTITCKISDDHFSGFETIVDLNYVDSIEEICEQVKKRLCVVLRDNNFETLLKIANNKKFHIHDHQFGEILLNPPKIIWICSHCPEYDDKNKKIDD